MFDPTLPQEGTPLDAAQMRAQLTSLKDLIDAIVSVAGAQVQSTTTLNPGQSATAAVTLGGSVLRFTFGIPRGHDGADGVDGENGEVTRGALGDAIAGTSANSNAVDFLGLVVSDPPTQAEMQSIADKVDELIDSLRR